MPDGSTREIEKMLREEVGRILSVDQAGVSVDTSFASLGMSSLAFVELLVVIEKTFAVKLIETDLSRDDFQSITTLAARIRALR